MSGFAASLKEGRVPLRVEAMRVNWETTRAEGEEGELRVEG